MRFRLDRSGTIVGNEVGRERPQRDRGPSRRIAVEPIVSSPDRVRGSAHARHGRRAALALQSACCTLLAILACCVVAAEATADEAVTFPGGPLTVYVGERGQCQSSYVIAGQVAGNYFPGGEPFEFSPVGDCGFFLAFPEAGAGQPTALQGLTYGFEGHAGPRGLAEYTPVSQSAVTGSGAAGDPYTQVTKFAVESDGETFALVTETTTYVSGAPQFTSTYDVQNTSASSLYFRAMYAGDLYVNGDDFGVGVYLAGPPRFIGGQNTSSGVIGGFQEAPAPALPWSSPQEACWVEVPSPRCENAQPDDNGIWHDVELTDGEDQAFNGSIDSAEVDNGTGVEWDQLRESGLAPGHEQAFTIINRTAIPNGLQISPANQTLTQGQSETVGVTALDTAGEPYAGKSVRYTVSGANPQSGTVTLNSSGSAQISYVGANIGIDTIQMYVDLGGTGSQVAADPAGTATVTFVPAPPPPPTPNSTYRIESIHSNPDGTITIVFVPAQAGSASVVVTVPTGTIANAATARRRCGRGQVRIHGRCRPAETVSARAVVSGAAGVPVTLRLRPSRKVRSALSHGHGLTLTTRLSYRSALGGAPTVHSFQTTIKAKRRHRN
jgi:hypothetical protein